MSFQVVALNKFLLAVSTFVRLVYGVNSNMHLIFLLILKGPCAHGALERILINVCLDMSFKIVGLCKLFLTNLKSEKSIKINSFKIKVNLCLHHTYKVCCYVFSYAP